LVGLRLSFFLFFWCYWGFDKGLVLSRQVLYHLSYAPNPGLEVLILLPQPPKYWDYQCVPPCLATLICFVSIDLLILEAVLTFAISWRQSTTACSGGAISCLPISLALTVSTTCLQRTSYFIYNQKLQREDSYLTPLWEIFKGKIIFKEAYHIQN
jgi:hypothetical protein